MEAWTLVLDLRVYRLDAVYLDYLKTFDVVTHKILLNELMSYGISGHVMEWIHPFLSDREMRVVEGRHGVQFKVEFGRALF